LGGCSSHGLGPLSPLPPPHSRHTTSAACPPQPAHGAWHPQQQLSEARQQQQATSLQQQVHALTAEAPPERACADCGTASMPLWLPNCSDGLLLCDACENNRKLHGALRQVVLAVSAADEVSTIQIQPQPSMLEWRLNSAISTSAHGVV
jgi:hypothetical protein